MKTKTSHSSATWLQRHLNVLIYRALLQDSIHFYVSPVF